MGGDSQSKVFGVPEVERRFDDYDRITHLISIEYSICTPASHPKSFLDILRNMQPVIVFADRPLVRMSDRGKTCCSHSARDLWLPLSLGLGPAQLPDTESPSTHPQGEHLRCPQKPHIYAKALRRTRLRGFCEEIHRINGWIGVNDLDDTID